MLIDCDTCAVRDLHCDDCVVTALLGPHVQADSDLPHGVQVDADERRALAVLADSGLVPRLRLVPLGMPAPGPPAASQQSSGSAAC